MSKTIPILSCAGLAVAVAAAAWYLSSKKSPLSAPSQKFGGMLPPSAGKARNPECADDTESLDDGIFNYQAASKKCKWKNFFARPRDSQLNDDGPRKSDR